MKTCKTCIYWTPVPQYLGSENARYCDFIFTMSGEKVKDTTGCEIVIDVNDDTGLDFWLKTGPDYFCPNHAMEDKS